MKTLSEHTVPSGAARPGAWALVAAVVIVAFGMLVACNKVWSFDDVFWHLKSGQWMLQHGRVLGHDPFTAPDPDAPNTGQWVNVHWGFQVLLALVHGLAGWNGLVVLKMLVFGGVLAVLAFSLKDRVPPAWLVLVLVCTAVGSQTRVRERPEMITYLLLAATLALTESVRRGAPVRRLWWLAPIHLAWANLHGVFVVGLVAMWSAVGGAFIDRLLRRQPPGLSGPDRGKPAGLAQRRALPPCLAATLACLVNPWPLETARLPLLLWSRVKGDVSMYTFGVSEFQPTWSINPWSNTPVAIALVMSWAIVAVMLVRIALEIVRADHEHLPAGHVLWFGLFFFAGAMAIRNIALYLIPAGFLLASDGGQLLNEIAAARPRWRAARHAAMPLALLLTAVLAFGFVTEAQARLQRVTFMQFGFGKVEGTAPEAMARWLGELELPGDVLTLDFGQAGTFIYYSWPRRQVYMDGRLEVQSEKRFERLYEFNTKLQSLEMVNDPKELTLPRSVRFVVVPLGYWKQMKALSASPRFKLLYVDRAAVCFGRLALEGEQVNWPAREELPPSNLDQWDRPLDPAGNCLLLEVERTPTWYRQSVAPVHWDMGSVFWALGEDRLAIRYFTVADRLGNKEPVSRKGMLAMSCWRLSEVQPIVPDDLLPADPNLSRALATFNRLEPRELYATDEGREYARQRVEAMITGWQIDSAYAALQDYLRNLPIPRRWHYSLEDLNLLNSLKNAANVANLWLKDLDLSSLSALERARVLTRKEVGRIDAAIAALAGSRLEPAGQVLLGDLYLRKGLTDSARKQYRGLEGRLAPPALLVRQGLCDWADGDLAAASENLRRAAAGSDPEAVLYLGLLLEQLGDYDACAGVLGGYDFSVERPGHEATERLLSGLKARMIVRGFRLPMTRAGPAGKTGLPPAGPRL